jgi:hypothetical protein
MQVYISNKEIEQIAEGLVQVSCGEPPPKYIDIDGIAAYLGITVVYEQIAENDPDRIGFASDGVRPLAVWRDGKKVNVLFPRNTVVLETLLLNPSENNRRRFVLAHEISHILIWRADPLRTAACFNSIYDTERTYSLDELHERMSLEECQANAMAAMILMPRVVLTDSVRRHLRRKTIPVYGDCIFLPKMKPALQKMSVELGVSYSSMLIQLRKYNLLEKRSMEEYFKKTMTDGGAVYGC